MFDVLQDNYLPKDYSLPTLSDSPQQETENFLDRVMGQYISTLKNYIHTKSVVLARYYSYLKPFLIFF